MKNIKTISLATFLFVLMALAASPIFAFAPPPPPPNGGNGDTPPPGGGAPIEGGLVIFIGLAAGYAWWKIGQEKIE